MNKIGVIGLGYVGLPVATAFARRFPGTLGYDRDPERVAELRRGVDRTRSVDAAALRSSGLGLCDLPTELADRDCFVVCVPTPIDRQHRPVLEPLESAARLVGGSLAAGDVVVFESTVYPGLTEGLCVPLLERASGLRAGADFGVAYSPERINPGDPDHGLEGTVKLVAAGDPLTRARVAALYRAVVPAGVVELDSIAVAEAAKVIENVQRDLNVALMNELAILCDRIGLDTSAVLDAAATKWNFHRYHPGLVGGHCIGVDPYYLTALARSVGLHPRVILAGRRVNDEMSAFVATKVAKLLAAAGRDVRGARVAVLGVTFKPDVPDTRNSRVPELVRELAEFGVQVLCHDPLADVRGGAGEARPGTPLAAGARGAEGAPLALVPEQELVGLDALVLAVPHRALLPLAARLAERGPALVVDVLGALEPATLPAGVRYWRL